MKNLSFIFRLFLPMMVFIIAVALQNFFSDTTVIVITIITAILDTLIGNFIFPGKVSVLKNKKGNYIIRKRHRLFFIPINMYYCSDLYDVKYVGRDMSDFTFSYYKATEIYSKEKALHAFYIFKNKKPSSEEFSVVWSSNQKQRSKEETLYLALGQAVVFEDKEKEEMILKEMKKHNIPSWD